MPDKEKYLKIIVFSFFIISIFYFSINFVFSGESPIYDDCPSCFDREPPEPGTTTTTTTTSTTTTAPFCGDGTVNNAEQCELPNTNNNIYCPQTTSTCLGNQTGTRDNKGNCNSTCQCMQDPFTYSCVKDSCGAVCSVNSDCPNKCVGDARYFSGACAAGCFCSYQSEECTGDGWYDTSGWACNGDCQRCKQQEYRNYYCEPSGCTHSVTDTRQVCENSPAGKHCSGGSFITTGYCGYSSPYCSNGCKYKIDRLECSASGTCNQFDYSDTFNCPADTVCSGSSCVNDLSCNTGDYQCKDQCSKAKPQYRCNGFGSCSSFWKWIDDSSCNPFSCSAGSCNGCEKDCGAECESNSDCQNFCLGSIRHFNGQCSSQDCQCSFTTEDCNNYDGWYNYGSWYYSNNNCKRCIQQKYRDYSCFPGGCNYVVTDTRENCENVNEGLVCFTGGYACIDECSRGKAQSVCSAGECVFSSWIDVLQCSPKKCLSGNCNGCSFSCGASCISSYDCQNRCEGKVRYYDGVCSGQTCSCTFKNEDCGSKDGWYETGESRWFACSDDACKQCEQKNKEHRIYSCSATGCTFTVDSEEWFDTGKRKVIVCPTGEYCSDGLCVKKECKGEIQIDVETLQFCPRVYYSFTASGLLMCNSKQVTFREGSCDGLILKKCTLRSNGKCSVNIRFTELGTPTVFACVDKNGDGDFSDEGEQDSITVNVNCNNCLPNKCPSATCHVCHKCAGRCYSYVSQYREEKCLNPDQTCEYSCIEGFCGAINCSSECPKCG